MNPAALFVFGSLVTLCGSPLLIAGVRKLRGVRRIWKRGPVSSRELRARSGSAWVEGTATALEEPIRSPLSDEPCLAYEYSIDERERHGRVSAWTTIDSGSERTPFVVDDGTGALLVEPEQATLEVEGERHVLHGNATDVPETIREFAEKSDKITRYESLPGTTIEYAHRFTEHRIEPGDTVHVYGKVQRAPPDVSHDEFIDACLTGGQSSLVIGDSRQFVNSAAIGSGRKIATLIGGVLFTLGIGLMGYGAWELL